jgi:hypothetical protein
MEDGRPRRQQTTDEGFARLLVHVTLRARELSRVSCSGRPLQLPLTDSVVVVSLVSQQG